MIKCTYCGGEKFYEGPSGGGSVNVLCANPECRHWFNDTIVGLQDLDRVEPTPAEKAEQQKQAEAEDAARRQALVMEGEKLFVAGRPAIDCFQETEVGSYATHADDAMRLAGWVGALKNVS